MTEHSDEHWQQLMLTIHSRIGTVKFLRMILHTLNNESAPIQNLIEDAIIMSLHSRQDRIQRELK